MVQEKVYTPSTETETLEFRAFGFANVAAPGPETRVHNPFPVWGSFALRVIENPQVAWSNPAFAEGAGSKEWLPIEVIDNKSMTLKITISSFRIHEKLVQ